MLVTEAGMVMLLIGAQMNAEAPIVSTELPSVTDSNAEHSWNAPSPMVVKELGRSMLFSALQKQNAYESIVVSWLPSANVIDSKAELEKAPSSSPKPYISSTELGIVMLLSLFCPAKAFPPIYLTPSGILEL